MIPEMKNKLRKLASGLHFWLIETPMLLWHVIVSIVLKRDI